MSFRTRNVGVGLPVDRLQKALPGFDFQKPTENLAQFRPKKTKTLILDLGTARTNNELAISGNTLWCCHCTDATATLQITIGDDSDPIIFKSGTYMLGFPFSKIKLTNAAQAGVTLYLVYFTAFIDESAKVF